MNHMANRIRKLPQYLFARIDKIKQDALAEGVDLIGFGVGESRDMGWDIRLPSSTFYVWSFITG